MVSDLKAFAYSQLPIAAQKKLFLSASFALLAGFLGINATIRIGWEILGLPYAGFLSTSADLHPTLIQILIFFKYLIINYRY